MSASAKEEANPSSEPAPSKKGAKKAEAKAKKEAEKARKAAEREAATASANSTEVQDTAKDNYGSITNATQLASNSVHLRALSEENVGSIVKLRAWIQNSRMQGARMAFVELREESNWTAQGVVASNNEGSVSKQMVKWIGGLKLESFILLEAVVKKPLEPVKSCKVHGVELHLVKVYLISAAPEMLGLGLAAANRAVGRLDEEDTTETKDEGLHITESTPLASLATHLNNPAMHKRAPVSQAIADIRIAVEDLFCEYLRARRFKKFHPPSLIGAASEGGSNVFRMPYFDKEAYLAQSPQFYKQFEIAGGRKRVFCVGPVFRAENSNTPRHMTEFIGLDLEMEIEEHYHEVIHMLEGVLLHIFRGLSTQCREEIELVRSVYPSEEFLLPEPGREVRLTFAEGQALLRSQGPDEFKDVTDEEDMSTAQEKALGALVREKYGTDFYVLDKFPSSARPFYAMPDPENPSVTNAYDFMMRGQEILSGGQRLHIPSELEANIRAKGLDPNQPGIKEYVDVFKSVGVPPHGGGGIGLDRVVAWYLNLPSVHLVCDYPRTPKRLDP
ncbi:BgTH12-02331 [Blumeria graminis f. sp. triticale]|uniref:Probable aspartate--tRNA ligase, cytoplasmic n=3 Tax=Blumeria graminis TaxID=34373 RepID=A0A061HG47_BLUGR|nr:Cytoplasmic aspartyl-tRNA synthetase [Blumeria graminis f. sp. tritici 96224]CAD6502090.1 BgTH12-02331 [Blumeria graminis f. sp. triticale]VDB86070.1 Bgt-3407 [Blumeria graminis f. sp. tritici]